MAKITYETKSTAVDPENPVIPEEVVEAEDLNEIKASVNALYDALPTGMAVFLVTQSGASNPTFTTLINTTGLTFTADRLGVGTYRIIPNTPPLDTKLAYFGGTSEISLFYDGDALNVGTTADGALTKAPIKFEIYP